MPAGTKKSRGSKSSGGKSPGGKSSGPWVALVVALLLGGGTGWMYSSTKQAAPHFDERRAEARQYFDEHLYLTLDPDLGTLLEASQFERRRLYLEDSLADDLARVPEMQRLSEQEELAVLVRDAVAAGALLPAGLYGVSSTSDPPARFFAHAAAHTTGVAVCLTLIVLLAAGMALENAWGHLVFALFCGASTAGLALARVASAPLHELPWAGSSGLAAALLGAYLALTLRGVDRFYGGLLSGWLLLPLWVASQYALVHQFWHPGFDQSLLLIHSLGLGAGFATATLVSLLGLERRADGSAHQKATPAALALGLARRAKNSGQEGEAFSLLCAEAERSPGNAEVGAALWELAKELGQEDAAAPAVVALVKGALREQRGADAAKLWLDLVVAGVSANVEPVMLVCIGEVLLDEGHSSEALTAMRRAAESEDPIPSALALRIVKVARDLDPDLTRISARLALADPRLPAAKRDALQALEEVAASAVGQLPAARSDPVEDVATAAPVASVETVPEAHTDTAESSSALAAEDAWQLEDEVGDIEALDPDALSEDSLSELLEACDDPAAADAEEIASWNDPGMLGDLTAEVSDGGDWDSDSTDTLALGLEPDQLSDAVEAVETRDPAALTPVEVDTAVQFESPTRTLKIVNVIPVAFGSEALELEAEGQGKTSLPYRRIEAVAVAAIQGLSERPWETSGGTVRTKPVLVLDLVLDWKSCQGGEMRVLRVRCDAFDPRRFVPGASPLEALKTLLDTLLSRTNATPLPDSQGARGNPFARFASLDAYEADVLGADARRP